ncbi:hypothetical protein HN51_015351 [Arachis hypogaea]
MQFESTQHHHPLYPELDPSVMAGTPSFLPKPGRGSTARQKASDRQRRQRIAELKAPHDLLPNQEEVICSSQAYILDDVIDHVKYLQLQLKELSGNRLQAESTAIPLVFHEEGYGHYIHQQKLNEPLEEMMGKLLEEHPVSASVSASQLLESNGLVLLPMELVQDLHQSTQIFGNGNALVRVRLVRPACTINRRQFDNISSLLALGISIRSSSFVSYGKFRNSFLYDL